MSSEQDRLLDTNKAAGVSVSSETVNSSYTEEYSGLSEPEPQEEPEDVGVPSRTTVFGWKIKPTVIGVGLVYFLFALSEIASASYETLKFARACETNKKNGICSPEDNQLLMSDYQQVSSVLVQIVSIAGLSIAGKVSDTYGRRPALIGMILLASTSHLVFFIAVTSSKRFQFKSYVLADLFTGLLGSSMGFIGLVNSYVADITSAKTRSSALASSLAFLYCGQILGPLLGSFILEYGKSRGISTETNDMFMIYLKSGLLAVTIIYVVFFVPESLPSPSSRVTAANSDSISVKSVSEYLSLRAIKAGLMGLLEETKLLRLPEEFVPEHLKTHLRGMRLQVLALVLGHAIIVMEVAVTVPLLVQYGIYKLHWDSSQISVSFSVISFAGLFTLSVSIPFLTRILLPKVFKMQFNKHRIDSIEYTVLIVGITSGSLLFFLCAFVQHTWQLYAIFCICSLAYGVLPCITGAVTKFYPAEKTSQLLMSMSMIGTALSVLSPPIFMNIYKYGISLGFPGLPFILCSFLYGFSALFVAGTRIFSMRIH